MHTHTYIHTYIPPYLIKFYTYTGTYKTPQTPQNRNTMRSLAGKHCIITGGSRGIGLAIARAFAASGASCTLVGRDQATLAAAVRTLPSPSSSSDTTTTTTEKPTTHAARAFDVSDVSGWDDMVADMKSRRTPIDVLVNGAGLSQRSLLVRTPAAEVERVLAANLAGAVWGCRAVLPRMMHQKSGCIINVSSLMAVQGGQGASVYAASKAGVVGLTRSLAWEVGRFGIRANVLLPGYIQTDMTNDMDRKGELSARIPLGRLGLADEVAHAATFLAENPYAHNCVLNIDGGMSAT
ncbi:hypothetical protein F4809DRAFT_627725 [Biscogniauxia mediterranea]|nr:hypothetical protein F4809DRAFT_627725 [Biscogniauxia mediterranea]